MQNGIFSPASLKLLTPQKEVMRRNGFYTAKGYVIRALQRRVLRLWF